jgi:Flp pilus assembly pilin Flp
MKHFFSQRKNQSPPQEDQERGQGIVEYLLLIALIGLAVIAIIRVLEPAIANVFSTFVNQAPVAPPALLSYTPPPTATPSNTPLPPPTAGPSPTHTPIPLITNTPTATPTSTATSTSTPTITPSPTSTNTPTPSPNVLFVVGDTNLDANDNLVRKQLQALGHLLLIRRDDQAQTADATGKVLVVISSSVDPGDVGTKFRTVAVPVLVWEHDLFDEMGMTGTNGHGDSGNSVSQIQILSPSHPMAAGNTGTIIVYSSNGEMSWGSPNSNANAVASLTSNTSRYVIFGYPSGVSMPGLTAPARRVGFLLYGNGASILNGTGWPLLNAAINWAING